MLMTPDALNYHHLLYFWAVAKEGSLRRASELLHVSQPSISAQLAEIEDTALLTDLGAQGLGFIPVYSAVLDEIERSSRFKAIGIANGLRMEVFAITAQRRLQHPGVAAMTAKAE